MSCVACEEFQGSNKVYCYRWKHANIEIKACEEHIKEIFITLNAAQDPKGMDIEKLRRDLATSKVILNAAEELLKELETVNIDLRKENDQLKIQLEQWKEKFCEVVDAKETIVDRLKDAQRKQ